MGQPSKIISSPGGAAECSITQSLKSPPSQFLNFFRQLFRLLLQLHAFLFQQFAPLRCQFLQHTGSLLDDAAQLVFRAFLQLLQRFDDGDDLQLQRFMDATPLGLEMFVGTPPGVARLHRSTPG